ncbi:hypothetical protein QM306_14015, partial [Burkholderia cenocepacia]|nr:hypothetical protein [Burkholderia cenocepacia]
LDREADTLTQTIDTYRRAWQLTVSRHRGGLASGLDVARAQTQLALAQARASDIAARRAPRSRPRTRESAAATSGRRSSSVEASPVGIGGTPGSAATDGSVNVDADAPTSAAIA